MLLNNHADPVMLQAMTWRHKLHVNQSRLCPEVVRYTISKTALQPFVNVICLIAQYQYTDETYLLAEIHRECSGHIHFNTCILSWMLILFYCLVSTADTLWWVNRPSWRGDSRGTQFDKGLDGAWSYSRFIHGHSHIRTSRCSSLVCSHIYLQ